jgi:hypothetical protein
MRGKRIFAGAALAAMLFVQGCLRYEVIKPKKPENKVVSLQGFDFKKRLPVADKLPLPKSLQKKKPEIRFITLESE